MSAAPGGIATPLLSVRDLAVGFGRAPAAGEVVHGVGFDLQPGETLAIVGESGSGKTVTALSINRLIDHAGGRILRGRMLFRPGDKGSGDRTDLDLARASPHRMRRIRGAEIGMIFQEPMTSLNPVHQIGHQIAESFMLHHGLSARAALRRAREALDRVRIPDAERRLRDYPHQLSGGMRQRVMIAIALACTPGLLIADEPPTALDVTIQAQIVALLAQLRDELGMSVIFITHDMGLVAEVADRVLVMRDGAVVERGELDRVFDRPSHPYTRDLLNAVPHFRHGQAVRAPRDGDRPAAATPATGSQDPILSVRDLSVRFPVRGGLLRRVIGVVRAVDGVDFGLVAGETLAIVGESGCGKSTIARAILGLVEPAGGAVTIVPAGGDRQGTPGIAQMVFQDPFASLNPRLTVRGLLAEPVIATGTEIGAATIIRMSALLRRVGMPGDSLDRYPHQFSGGERQRLCIARALMTDPRIVLLDEAVSALDVSIQAQVLDLLMELQAERGLAYLFISHDMAVVERVAHRIAVMFAGQIVEFGSAARVLAKPAHSYTRRLIAAVPTVDRSHRRRHFALDTSEPPSVLRPPGYEPPPAVWRRLEPDHMVRAES
ncbi:MAG: ABC transporter ATP-binding protein [Inquilinus sp.]|nr:ABC transporter ATP-binding protein [Inquilinus sp.]